MLYFILEKDKIRSGKSFKVTRNFGNRSYLKYPRLYETG